MKIVRIDARRESIPLDRPYTIAYKTTTAVELFVVRIETTDGHFGLGTGSPGEHVTGESPDACEAGLASDTVQGLVGDDPRALGRLCRSIAAPLAETPAARAAVDIALHDLFGKIVGVPVADVLGRCHDGLPTSITVGIKSVEETVVETREYLAKGFDHLKIKLGKSYEEDEARLRRVREEFGDGFRIRIDANQGYSDDETRRFEGLADALDIELIEQPLPADAIDTMRALPASLRKRIAADESLIDERAAINLAAPPVACGIFNIKLMKCGGISPAMGIGAIADAAGLELMWGCMDESCVSISAAMHAAYACPATRYLDLDGSFDLPRDPAEGGFALRDGRLWLTGEPGLGVRPAG